ncbi:MAG: fdtA [Gammaproteobacteria bacterium]|jgi:dTDP-4-dehydrorhamnose 3,5-epimerase-like enzyme|nr:fdtA [Gammaproteobacteria bacterium]
MDRQEFRLINFEKIGDHRGQLITLENHKSIPFDIKRMYYIFDTKPNVTRGMHAHKKLEQILIAINGSCEILLDDGQTKESFKLNSKEVGLYVGNNVWREMHNFSQDCVLLVLASEIYDESDYIRNYQDFLANVSPKTQDNA